MLLILIALKTELALQHHKMPGTTSKRHNTKPKQGTLNTSGNRT